MDKLFSKMQKIVNEKVEYYKSDFDIDKEILGKAKPGESFIWLVRPCGTNICRERDAYIKDSAGHNGIRYYAEQHSDGIEAYRVKGNRIKKLDFRKLYESICKRSVSAKGVEWHYEKGSLVYPVGERAEETDTLGKFQFCEYQADEYELALAVGSI